MIDILSKTVVNRTFDPCKGIFDCKNKDIADSYADHLAMYMEEVKKAYKDESAIIKDNSIGIDYDIYTD